MWTTNWRASRSPGVGDRFLVHDYEETPVAVIEATEVRVLPVGDVDLAFARDEGEGFDSVEQWRSAHEAFWEGHQISDRTSIVAVRFRVVSSCVAERAVMRVSGLRRGAP